MATIYFDGPNKQVEIQYGPAESSATVVVKTLYSDWKDWVLTGDNSKYLQAFSSIGGESVGGGEYVGSTFFLLNGWKITPIPTQNPSTLILDGNLFPEVAGQSLYDYTVIPGGYSFSVERRTSTLPVGVGTGGDPLVIAAAVWATVIDAGYTALDLYRLIAAVQAGVSTVNPLVSTTNVAFKQIGAGTKDRVSAVIGNTNQDRQSVTLDPT